MSEAIYRTLVLSGLFGTLGIVLGRRLRIPSLLFYLAFGLLAGPMLLNWIRPEILGESMMPAVEIAVAVIIFEAGLGLPLAGWKTAPKAIRRMLTAILGLTGLFSALIARYLVGLPWAVALLFGSIIIVTGPTVINPLLKNMALSRRIEVLLRWESVWADCAGVILSGVVLEGILSPSSTGIWLLISLVLKLTAGLLFGIAAGWALGRSIIPWTARLGDASLPSIVALSSAVAVFFLSNIFVHGSGVVASAAAGMTLARYPLHELESIKHFKDQITTMLVAFLFVLLSAQIDFRQSHVPLPALAAASLSMIFVVRPLVSVLGLYRTSLSIEERLFVGLTGPRGIISAAVVSYYALLLADKIPAVDDMRLLTFTTILLSGGFVSLFAKNTAVQLNVRLEEYRTGIVIVGISNFSIELGKKLKNYVDVIMLDSDQTKCSRSSDEGLVERCGNALGDELYENLVETGIRRAIICTPNNALNNLIARKSSVHLGADRVFVITPEKKETRPYPTTLNSKMIAFTFDGLAIGEMGDRLSQGKARIAVLDKADAAKDAIPLAMETPDKGIRLLRAGTSERGRGIYFIPNSDSRDG